MNDERDWLIEDSTSNQTKDAVIFALTASIQIARNSCYPPLSLEETQNLLETVWYEMESQDSQSLPV